MKNRVKSYYKTNAVQSNPDFIKGLSDLVMRPDTSVEVFNTNHSNTFKKMTNTKLDIIISENLVPYAEAMQFMQNKVADIIAGKCNQAIWLLEHPCVYTGGRTAKVKDLLEDIGVPYYKTDRGGQITFHGPGQKIVYVMIDLKTIFKNNIDIRYFVRLLCKWLHLVLQEFNIQAVSNKKDIGLWVDQDDKKGKIVSIGLKVRRTISYHGIALNINPDLSYFKNIVPCGISNASITSIDKIFRIDRHQFNVINDLLIKHFLNLFNYKLGERSLI